jgi:hypothetical protein
MVQPIDLDDDLSRTLIVLHPDDPMGFQAQRFPDIRFQAHRSLASWSRAWRPEQDTQGEPMRSAFSCPYVVTLSGEQPDFPSAERSTSHSMAVSRKH